MALAELQVLEQEDNEDIEAIGEGGEDRPHYTPYGAARDFWRCKDPEVLLAGPADTGKTRACLEKLDRLCRKYPRSHCLMVRRFRSDLKESSVYVYVEYVLRGNPEAYGVTVIGGSNPREFHYENGSRIITRGLDDPQGTLGGAYDFAFVSQSEELDEKSWNVLASRVSGRAGNSPYPQLMADANPGPPYHFLKHRKNITWFESRHIDNPEIYDQSTKKVLDNGEVVADILESGKSRIDVLKNLTGIERDRLYLGKWVAAEGLVYPEFNADIHVVDPVDDGGERMLIFDFGYVHPMVVLWVKVDEDQRMIVTREIYRTKVLVEEIAEEVMNITWEAGEWISAVVCDHDAEDRATLEKHFGTETIPAIKGRNSISGGINMVKQRLKIQHDGRPRLMIASDATVGRDQSLMDSKRPSSTRDEFGVYVWATRGGRTGGGDYEDKPVDRDNHGMDSLRYGVLFLDHHEEMPIQVGYRRPYNISRF